MKIKNMKLKTKSSKISRQPYFLGQVVPDPRGPDGKDSLVFILVSGRDRRPLPEDLKLHKGS